MPDALLETLSTNSSREVSGKLTTEATVDMWRVQQLVMGANIPISGFRQMQGLGSAQESAAPLPALLSDRFDTL